MGLEIKIPGNWKIAELKSVCQAVTGTTPPKSDPKNYGNDIPFVKPPQIFDKPVHNAPEKLSLKGANLARILPPNSVLVTCIGNLGRTAINTVSVAFNQQINALIPSKEINGKFLFYQTQSWYFRKQLEELSSATTVAIVNKGKFETIEISVPPIHAQISIVDKIEELFSELDKGIENLKTAQQQLKVYRQAVLYSIMEYEATHTLDSVIEKLDQGWSPKCHNEASKSNEEWAVIKTTAVQAGFFLDKENKILPEDLKPRTQHELKAGDILITRAGPRVRVGICCMVKKVRPKLLNCDKVYRMRIDTSIAIPKYIEVVLNSPKYAKEIERMKTGISDSGVNLTQKAFLKILIPVPPINQQKQIVQDIESRLSVCDKIEETITTSLQQAEALRQSILKRAFEGKLMNYNEV